MVNTFESSFGTAPTLSMPENYGFGGESMYGTSGTFGAMDIGTLETNWWDSVDMGDVATGFQALGTATSMIGDTIASNQDADALREQARLNDLRADEILRRASISMEQVSKGARKTVSTQATALTGRGISATGNLAAALSSDTISEAYDEITNIDKAARFDSNLAKAQAASNRQAADNAESSVFGTVLSIGVGVGVGVMTGNPYAGMGASKATKAVVG